ncbi:hypothetical protein PR048_024382, partial [Dryococelus australis]
MNIPHPTSSAQLILSIKSKKWQKLVNEEAIIALSRCEIDIHGLAVLTVVAHVSWPKPSLGRDRKLQLFFGCTTPSVAGGVEVERRRREIVEFRSEGNPVYTDPAVALLPRSVLALRPETALAVSKHALRPETALAVSKHALRPETALAVSKHALRPETALAVSKHALRPETALAVSKHALRPETALAVSKHALRPETALAVSKNALRPETALAVSKHALRPETALAVSKHALRPETALAVSKHALRPETALAVSKHALRPETALAVSKHALRPETALAVSKHALRPETALAVSKHALRSETALAVSKGRPPVTHSVGAPPIWGAGGSGFESRSDGSDTGGGVRVLQEGRPDLYLLQMAIAVEINYGRRRRALRLCLFLNTPITLLKPGTHDPQFLTQYFTQTCTIVPKDSVNGNYHACEYASYSVPISVPHWLREALETDLVSDWLPLVTEHVLLAAMQVG